MGVADMGTTFSCSTLRDVQSTIGKRRDMPLPPGHSALPAERGPSSSVMGGMAGVQGAETPRCLPAVALFCCSPGVGVVRAWSKKGEGVEGPFRLVLRVGELLWAPCTIGDLSIAWSLASSHADRTEWLGDTELLPTEIPKLAIEVGLANALVCLDGTESATVSDLNGTPVPVVCLDTVKPVTLVCFNDAEPIAPACLDDVKLAEPVSLDVAELVCLPTMPST